MENFLGTMTLVLLPIIILILTLSIPFIIILIVKYLIRYAIKTYKLENKDYLEYLKTKEISKKE